MSSTTRERRKGFGPCGPGARSACSPSRPGQSVDLNLRGCGDSLPLAHFGGDESARLLGRCGVSAGRSRALALLAAPLRGRRAELALEGPVEGGLGLVAEPLGDPRKPRAGRTKLACSEREAPFRQVLDRRLSDVVREALGQDRARAADLAR